MKKIVLRAEINCERCRKEAYEAISKVEGVETATVDIKERKVTVIGDADPARLTMELRRLGWAEIESVVEDNPKPVIKEDKKNPPKDDKKDKEAQVKNGPKKDSEGSKKEGKNPSAKQDSTSTAQPQVWIQQQPWIQPHPVPLDVNVYVRGFPEEKPHYNQTLVIRGDCHHCCEDVYYLSDENPNACSIC